MKKKFKFSSSITSASDLASIVNIIKISINDVRLRI